MLNLLPAHVTCKLAGYSVVNSHRFSVVLPPKGMFFQVFIINSVIQSHGQERNVKKRSQFGVLACNVFGPVAVPDSLPSLPQRISSSRQIGRIIVSKVTELCVSKGGHLLHFSLPSKSAKIIRSFGHKIASDVGL